MRVFVDCIVPTAYEGKSGFTIVKSHLYGAPERTVRYLFLGLGLGRNLLFTGAKTIFPYKLGILEAKIFMASRMVNFLSTGFPHNFSKNK